MHNASSSANSKYPTLKVLQSKSFIHQKSTSNPQSHINLNLQMEDLNRENLKAREEASKYRQQHGEAAVSDRGFICE